MTYQASNPSLSYRRSLEALHELHKLAVAGKDEEPEVEGFCNEMERHWGSLSERERARLSGLSADLDSVLNPLRESDRIDPRSQDLLTEDLLAVSGQLDETLDVLRRWAPLLSSADLSHRRGLAWEGAGDHETAAIFFEHTDRLGAPGRVHATERTL